MASRPKQTEPRPAPRLYLITPPVSDANEFAPQLTAALSSAEVAAVLLRLADGDERSLINRVKTLAPLAQDKGAAVLLDGHADLAARGGADGAHLAGPDALAAGLEQLKPDRIAGAGELTSRHDVMVAADSGADYVLFGGPHVPLDVTSERVNWAAELFELPCVAYASDMSEIAPLVAAGADFIAIDFPWRDPRGIPAALAEAATQLRLPEPAS
jgi:thiamine-phosphate pyrophosphorylase